MNSFSQKFKRGVFGASLLAAVCAGTVSYSPAVLAQSAPKVLKKVPPEFPEDVGGGISQGVVKAKVSIDPTGKVTDVTIVEADPKRVFDRSAQKALMGWKFEGSGAAQTYEVKLIFRSDD